MLEGKYDSSKSSSSAAISSNSWSVFRFVQQGQKGEFVEEQVPVIGKALTDSVSFEGVDGDYSTAETLTFYAPVNGRVGFSSQDFGGILGLAPYYGTPESQRKYNLLEVLKQSGLIENQMFSIYIANPKLSKQANLGKSQITFGSFDQAFITGKRDTRYLREFRADIENSGAWKIRTPRFTIGDMILESLDSTAKKYTLFDPGSPFIYVPESDFNSLTEVINKGFASRYNNGTDICHKDAGNCYFTAACSNLILSRDLDGRDFDFSFVLDTSNSTTDISRNAQAANRFSDIYFNLSIPTAHLLIPGEEMRDLDSKCFLPFFKSEDEAYQDTWVVGRIIFELYYFIFDMTRAGSEQASLSSSERVLKIGISVPKEGVIEIEEEEEENPPPPPPPEEPETEDPEPTDEHEGSKDNNGTNGDEPFSFEQAWNDLQGFVDRNPGTALSIGIGVIVIFGALITICVYCFQAKNKEEKREAANKVLEEMQAQLTKSERDRGFVKPSSHDSFISDEEEKVLDTLLSSDLE